MQFTEEMLKRYAAPLSATEDQKCINAINMIRDALRGVGFADVDINLRKIEEDTDAYMAEMKNSVSGRNVKIFVQGSYANKTNVKAESDVDISVVLESMFQGNYRIGTTSKSYGFTESTDNIMKFKDDVEQALKNKFGTNVERGNKAILVKGNGYRVDSDVVPCLRYRDYSHDFNTDSSNFIGGIEIRPDSGGKIINFPEQHIKNGRQKNISTNQYYKKMVRIIKKIRYIMQENRYKSADNVSSFGLESLLWNVPDNVFTRVTTMGLMFQGILNYLNNSRMNFTFYKEANGIKPLCPTYQEIDQFTKFLNDLYTFYDYKL